MVSQPLPSHRYAWVVGLALLSSLGTACGNASAPATTEVPSTPAATEATEVPAATGHLAHPVRVTVNGTHVHSTASVTAPPVGLVFGNDSVDYLGRYNAQWAKVRLRDGTTGFLAAAYLEGLAPTPTAPPAALVSRPAPPVVAAKSVVVAKIVAPKAVVPQAAVPKPAPPKPVAPKAGAATPEALAKAVAPPARTVPEQGELAYYCASGNVVKYHSSPDCRGLKKCQATVDNMPLSEAEATMSPCKICH